MIQIFIQDKSFNRSIAGFDQYLSCLKEKKEMLKT